MKIMVKRIFKIIWRTFLFTTTVGLLGLLLPRLITTLHAWNKIHPVVDAPAERVAIIFGAGLRRDGSPTAVLRDRVETGASLYFSGKVEKLLMSGDNQSVYYNEPQAMRQYAISLGIPDEAIVMDSAGSRTYDTCYRAKAIFGLASAVLVTQDFHLPRALYTCDNLGIEAVGVAADRRDYRSGSLLYWNLRELPATLSAMIEVHLLRPHPLAVQPDEIPLVD